MEAAHYRFQGHNLINKDTTLTIIMYYLKSGNTVLFTRLLLFKKFSQIPSKIWTFCLSFPFQICCPIYRKNHENQFKDTFQKTFLLKYVTIFWEEIIGHPQNTWKLFSLTILHYWYLPTKEWMSRNAKGKSDLLCFLFTL